MTTSKLFNRIGKSIVLAAALVVAIMSAGNAGIASAAPAQQGGIAANVVVTMPPSVGAFDDTPGQSWVWLYRVADHGTYTGTVASALKSGINIGKPGSHELKSNGNRLFRGSADAGDFLVVAHLGATTLVMNKIETIASGDQYPGQTHTMTWAGSGTSATTGNKSGGAAKNAKKAPPVVPTSLCMPPLPLAKTGGKAYVAKTGPFQGKVAFVLVTGTSVFSVEAAEHVYKAGGGNAVVIDFTGVGLGEMVEIPSGAYQVFNVEANDKLTPLGFKNAFAVVQPSTVTTPAQVNAWKSHVAHVDLDRLNGTCSKYPIDMLMTDPARTGSDDLPGGLAGIVLAGTLGSGMLFYFLVLPMLMRRRQSAVMVIG